MKDYNNLPKRQKEVIKYISDHPEDIAMLTIRELSETLNINHATILRACKELGYKGFNDLKKHHKTQYRRNMTGYGSMLEKLESKDTPKKQSQLEEAIKGSLLTDLNILDRTIAKISLTAIEEVAKIILNSNRTYIIGLEAARSLAMFLTTELRTYIPNVQEILYTNGYLFDFMRHLKKEDVVIGISFGKCIRQTVNAVKTANEKGVRTITITDSDLSPLYKYSDISLLTASASNSYFSTFIAAMSIEKAIIAGTAELLGDKAIEQLKIIEQQWEEAKIYYNE